MQSSPSEIPSPAFAPSRQRSPDRDHLGPAARQRAHDRRAAADVGAVADDDSGGDPALDHRGAERAGVEVHEALVHDRRAVGEVRAEPYAVGVGDPHAGRGDVVGHARELVDRRDRERLAGDAEAHAHRVESRGIDRSAARPGDVAQHAEQAGQVGLVRADEPVRQQVQPQVRVVRVGGRLGERADHGEHDHAAHPAALVPPGRRGEIVRPLVLPDEPRPGRTGRVAEPEMRLAGTTCPARGRRARSAWRARSPTRPAASARSSARTPYYPPIRASSRSTSRSTLRITAAGTAPWLRRLSSAARSAVMTSRRSTS